MTSITRYNIEKPCNATRASQHDSRPNLEAAARLLGLSVAELSHCLRATVQSTSTTDHNEPDHSVHPNTSYAGAAPIPSLHVVPQNDALLDSTQNDPCTITDLFYDGDQAFAPNEAQTHSHQQQFSSSMSMSMIPCTYSLPDTVPDRALITYEPERPANGGASGYRHFPQSRHNLPASQILSNTLDLALNSSQNCPSDNRHVENHIPTSMENWNTASIARAAPAPTVAILRSPNNLSNVSRVRDGSRKRKRSTKEQPSSHTEQTTEAESSSSHSLVDKSQSAEPKRKRQRRGNRHELTDDPNSIISSRAPFNDVDRAETAKTREMHACIKCQLGKSRCRMDPHDPSGPCLDCKKLTRSLTSQLPCLRYSITDASLYREQEMPFQLFSRRWKTMEILDVNDWASDDIRTIELTQVFLNVPYRVQVREFHPQDGDMLEEVWHDGGHRYTQQIPPYALVDMKGTADMFDSWIEKNVVAYINGTVGDQDELIFQTYRQAVKHIEAAKTPEERDLITLTLKLWVACRKTSHPERICGDETLGAQLCEHPQSPWYRHIPMPPIMIAQFECIMYTRFLRPLSALILKRLKSLVMGRKKKHWLTIYLTMFMLLHSCSMIARRDAEYALQINAPTKYANPYAIMGHQAGARMLIAHFHHVNQGEMPFQHLSRAAAQRSFQVEAELNDDQVNFVQWTALMVAQKAGEMKYVQHHRNYTHELYWVSQLYNIDWKPLHLE